MIKALKIFISAIPIVGAGILITINCQLHNQSKIKIVEGDSINYDTYKQLIFLKNALRNNADQEMQSLYPEGYIFMNALYGLTWINLIENSDPHSKFYTEGHKEIEGAFGKINSPTGKLGFEETLPLPFGAFYTGWSTYLIGKKLSVESSENRDTLQVRYFKEQCQKISKAIKEKTYPASYYEGVWPADVMLCVASLAIYDKLFTPLYTSDIKSWITSVKLNLDSNGLIPHSIHYKDQTIDETARGSSQSLMLIFLREIEPEFAKQQYILYKENFVDNRLGLTGIREYPKGYYGIGDVDSGPVILQMGGAATIVGIKTLYLYGDYELCYKISGTIEGLGFPFEKKGEKSYLFGVLPMVDVFVAWANSNQTPDDKVHPTFLTFHLYSLLLLIIILGIVWWFWKKT